MKLLVLKSAVAICCVLLCSSAHLAAASNELPVQNAISSDPAVAQAAIAALRAEGQDGLDALYRAHADEIEQKLANPTDSSLDSPQWKLLCTALDEVGQQKDNFAARLYWHTDLESAKAAAQASGKPILSLRLLGKLDEEFSCANSRFFRTVLYANASVSDYLRDRFILHWQSVRPAPRITVDFGDGRKMERTVTGNSIHYILDSEGNVIDALPGLYGASAFLSGLEQAEAMFETGAKLSAASRAVALREYHKVHMSQALAYWQRDLAMAGLAAPDRSEQSPTRARALQADRVAVSKSGVERRLVLATTQSRDVLAKATDALAWSKLAEAHRSEALLDRSSTALFESKTGDRATAVGTGAEHALNADFNPMLRTFTLAIAEDTLRNEYVLHTAIHEWFVRGLAPAGLDALNEKIYSELFLTPSDDPWLGLKPDAYSALDRDGVCTAPDPATNQASLGRLAAPVR